MWYPPTVLNTPTVLKISPHIYHDIPHGTEHPHGTQDIPHGTQDIPHGTQDIPHGTHDIPHGTEHPHGTAQTLYRVILWRNVQTRGISNVLISDSYRVKILQIIWDLYRVKILQNPRRLSGIFHF